MKGYDIMAENISKTTNILISCFVGFFKFLFFALMIILFIFEIIGTFVGGLMKNVK